MFNHFDVIGPQNLPNSVK